MFCMFTLSRMEANGVTAGLDSPVGSKVIHYESLTSKGMLLIHPGSSFFARRVYLGMKCIE